MKRAWLIGVVLSLGLVPSFAAAQNEVMVLGIRSVEGDDEFTRNLTGALRNAASQVQGWNVSDREVTLTQMALAHGCDEPDPTCLAAIAESLEAGRIIYGDVRRTSSAEPFDFAVAIHNFDTASGEIEHSVADTIPGIRQDIDDLRDPARRWVAALSGAPRTGTLTVSVNAPGAEVFVDDESVGTTNDQGHLQVDGVEAGTRSVRVVAPGHSSFRGSVSVEAYGDAMLEAELEAGAGGEEFPVNLVVGIGLLVVAAAFAGGWAYSGARLLDIDGSAQWDEIRSRYGLGTQNLCATSTLPDATELCSESSNLEVLQFVFGALTLAAAGAGGYFLVTALLGGDPEEEQAVQLVPSVGPDHAYLGLQVRF